MNVVESRDSQSWDGKLADERERMPDGSEERRESVRKERVRLDGQAPENLRRRAGTTASLALEGC